VLQLCVIAAGPGGTYQLWRGRQRERAATRQVQVIIDPTNALPSPNRISLEIGESAGSRWKAAWPQLIIRPMSWFASNVLACCHYRPKDTGQLVPLFPFGKIILFGRFLAKLLAAKPHRQQLQQDAEENRQLSEAKVEQFRLIPTFGVELKCIFTWAPFDGADRRFSRQQLSPLLTVGGKRFIEAAI